MFVKTHVSRMGLIKDEVHLYTDIMGGVVDCTYQLTLDFVSFIFYNPDHEYFFILQPFDQIQEVAEKEGIIVKSVEPRAIFGNQVTIDEKTLTFLKMSGKIT